MKSFILAAVTVLCAITAISVEARDTRNMFPLSEALETEDAKSKLDKNIRFFFGKQNHPAIAKNFGEVMTNKKTNAFNKTDKRACEWAFLSAMLSFKDRAIRDGGNAIVNIRSFYKKNEISSETEYECGAGGIMAGVTFKGDIVKLAK
ncbi:MAG: excinuclease ATPase subunit [Gammaproteobacteria bacterium]